MSNRAVLGSENHCPPFPPPLISAKSKRWSYNFSFGDSKKRDRRLGIKMVESEASRNPIKAERL